MGQAGSRSQFAAPLKALERRKSRQFNSAFLKRRAHGNTFYLSLLTRLVEILHGRLRESVPIIAPREEVNIRIHATLFSTRCREGVRLIRTYRLQCNSEQLIAYSDTSQNFLMMAL